MKLVTWNINSIRARMDLLGDFLQRQQPDVLCLQETKVVDDLFPIDAITKLGYQAAFTGQKSYNGVAILSKLGASDVRVEFPLATNSDQRLISAVYEGIRVYCAYFPNGRDPSSEHMQIKLQWIDALGDLIFGDRSMPPSLSEEVVLLGDYNVAPEPRDVYSVEAMEGKTHFTMEERTTLLALRERGFVDTFRLKHEEAGIYSWWDYRLNMFKRNLGLRINHAWTTPLLAEKVSDVYVDKPERAKEHASDHAPVILEIEP